MSEFAALAASAIPLTGGYGGETYLVQAAGEDAVLKLYVRQSTRAEVDAALLELVRGLVPVPRVLDAKFDGSPEDPPYVLTERLPGVNLERYLADTSPDEAARRRIGAQLGDLLVRLAGMPFLRYGEFTGRDLTLTPYGRGSMESYFDLLGFFDQRADALGLTAEQLTRLREVVADAEYALTEAVDRPCLSHSDFNPKNLLVDPETATITGLVDWEFAHAGSPYVDLGNLLRFCTDPVLAGGVLAAVRAGRPELAEHEFPLPKDERLVTLGRAADLLALIDLAVRAGLNPVATAAQALLVQMADSGELAGNRANLVVPGGSPSALAAPRHAPRGT